MDAHTLVGARSEFVPRRLPRRSETAAGRRAADNKLRKIDVHQIDGESLGVDGILPDKHLASIVGNNFPTVVSADRRAGDSYRARRRVGLTRPECYAAGYNNFSGSQQNRVGIRILDEEDRIVPWPLRRGRADIGVGPGKLHLRPGQGIRRSGKWWNGQIDVGYRRLDKLECTHIRVIPVGVGNARLGRNLWIVEARIAQ